MDRYGRRDSITAVELELLSPFYGFGRHDQHASEPTLQTHNIEEPRLPPRETRWKSKHFWQIGTGYRKPHESGSSSQYVDTIKPLISSGDKQSKSSKRSQLWGKFHGGWRTGVALGALGAVIVLTINVSLLIWIKAKYHVPNDGAATVFEGSCSQKTKISVWCHLAINVCSTLLLSASNTAMQVLSAPTRADVDKAHARGSWMDIGISSIRNLRICHWQRVTLWLVLVLSSIPLHLL